MRTHKDDNAMSPSRFLCHFDTQLFRAMRNVMQTCIKY